MYDTVTNLVRKGYCARARFRFVFSANRRGLSEFRIGQSQSLARVKPLCLTNSKTKASSMANYSQDGPFHRVGAPSGQFSARFR